jgi:hypothetical protein
VYLKEQRHRFHHILDPKQLHYNLEFWGTMADLLEKSRDGKLIWFLTLLGVVDLVLFTYKQFLFSEGLMSNLSYIILELIRDKEIKKELSKEFCT